MNERDTLIYAKKFLLYWSKHCKDISLSDAFVSYIGDIDISTGSDILNIAERLVHIYSYDEYLRTRYWRNVRRDVRRRYKRCQMCRAKNLLNVHHLNYRTLGCENVGKDLTLLCRSCHKKVHSIDNKEKGKR